MSEYRILYIEDNPENRLLVRRVAERRSSGLLFVTYDRGAYRRWRGDRPDTDELRTAWAVLRAGKPR